jgi:hypothetical protein
LSVLKVDLPSIESLAEKDPFIHLEKYNGDVMK